MGNATAPRGRSHVGRFNATNTISARSKRCLSPWVARPTYFQIVPYFLALQFTIAQAGIADRARTLMQGCKAGVLNRGPTKSNCLGK